MKSKIRFSLAQLTFSVLAALYNIAGVVIYEYLQMTIGLLRACR